MTRILADLPDDDIAWLDARAAEQGRSRAWVLRDAVATYRTNSAAGNKDWIARGAGYWGHRAATGDPLPAMETLRGDRGSQDDR